MSGGPGVGGGPSPATSIDLSQPLFLVLKQLEDETQIPFDELEEFVDDVIDELLSKPPDVRFERGAEVVKSSVVDRFGSEAAYASLLPASPEQFLRLVATLLDYWIDEAVDGVVGLDGRELTAGLAYLTAIATIRDLIEAVDDGRSDEDARIAVSSMIALYARIFNEHQRDEDGAPVDWDAIIEDTLRARETLDEVQDGSKAGHVSLPDESSGERGVEVLQIVGAVLLYDRSEISIGRGAEMAAVSQDEFEEHLVRSGVRPRLGPDSTDDLHTGPDL